MDGGEILKLELRHTKVKNLLEYLTKHDKHCDRSPHHIAWNIKVRCNEGDLSDPKIREEYRLKDEWDERWEKHLEEDHDLFYDCCNNGLGFVGDTAGKYKPFCPWITEEGDEFDYELGQGGRSGGWLELYNFEGGKVDLDSLEDQYAGLCETEEKYACSKCTGHFIKRENGPSTWKTTVCHNPEEHTESYYENLENELLQNEEWLEKLVRFCKSLDEFDASKELTHQFAFRRQELEDEWEGERKEETQKQVEMEEWW